jgi:hypothetical protein
MVWAKSKEMVRIAICLSLLLVLCLPAGARIHGPIGLEEAEAGPPALVYAPMPKGAGGSLLTTGRRVHCHATGGFFKIDWGPGGTVLDSIPPLFPFAADSQICLRHRADRSAISIRAPPR